MEKGLFGKYKIEKANGTPLDENARYFVLRYDKDPAALIALKAYMENTTNRALKMDLIVEISNIEQPNGFFGNGCTLDRK